MLSNEVAGHVNLMNRRAIQGMELLNPGHIDPGWGLDSAGKVVGFELTAVVRNISNKPLKLRIKDPFMTIVFDQLQTPSTKPYPPSEILLDPIKRAADLDVKAQRIREFVELQKGIQNELKSKMSYKEVLGSLGLLTATLGLVITFVVAFVATSATPVELNINGFKIDRSIVLFFLGFLLTIIVIVVSIWRSKTTPESA